MGAAGEGAGQPGGWSETSRALEQALAELAQRKAPTPSVSRPLGYLMPQNTFVQWDFQRDGDLVAVAEDLAEAVATYGQPFIDKWSDLQVFSAEIAESRLLLNDEKFFVLPVVAALSGDRFTADELVRRELERVGTSDDAYSKAYRQFAERFAAQSF